MIRGFIIVLNFIVFKVTSLAQCGFASLSPAYCSNDATVQLSPFVPGGVFYGNGVSGSIFDPGTVSSGSQVISYSYCVSNYTIENPAFVQASYNPTYVTLGDNTVSAALPIGFNFQFFCTTYSQFYISSNGFITFTPPQSAGCCQGISMPTGSLQNEMIAVAWTDLDPSQGGTIRYSHLGTAPNRTLLVSFNCIFHKQGQGPVTAEILLEEGTNAIEFSTFIKPIPTGTVTYNTTMGIQGPNGTAYVVTGRNGTSNWIASQEQIRFIAEPSCTSSQTVHVQETPAVYATASKTTVCSGEKVILTAYGAGAYSWMPGNLPYATFSVAPSSTIIYTLTGTVANCSATNTVAINVNTCTGIEESESQSRELSVYPIPSSGEITVIAETAGNYFLFDSMGKLVTKLFFSKDNAFKEQLTNLQEGVYFLISSDQETKVSRKIAVIR